MVDRLSLQRAISISESKIIIESEIIIEDSGGGWLGSLAEDDGTV